MPEVQDDADGQSVSLLRRLRGDEHTRRSRGRRVGPRRADHLRTLPVAGDGDDEGREGEARRLRGEGDRGRRDRRAVGPRDRAVPEAGGDRAALLGVRDDLRRRPMIGFWEAIDAQLALVRKATTADEVIAILQPPSSGDGFFGGAGGDASLMGALQDGGWTILWARASYHYAMRAPGGDIITYVEGDVYRGNDWPVG